MSHTPGPWEAIAPKNDSNVLDVYQVGNRHHLLHRGFWGHKADARLIAAAPDLLEALQLVTDALNDPGVGDIDQWKRDCKTATAKARAAISKATLGQLDRRSA